MLKKVVEFVVKELVEDAAAVKVTQEQEDKKIILSIHVNQQDLGKVIGKGGVTIRAIRSLVDALKADPESQVVVDVAK